MAAERYDQRTLVAHLRAQNVRVQAMSQRGTYTEGDVALQVLLFLLPDQDGAVNSEESGEDGAGEVGGAGVAAQVGGEMAVLLEDARDRAPDATLRFLFSQETQQHHA